MNKIEAGEKLDFQHVLIRPKRSTINSRSCVDLEREFTFRYSKYTWKGVPVISANMDTTGTLEVYETLSKHKIVTALHKFYTLQDLLDYKETHILDPDYFMISTGIHEHDFERLVSIFTHIDCKWICIDVANGYMDNLTQFCRKVRNFFPDKIIVAGNVVTREVVEELILNGQVDVVKAGIGPGCFASNTRILLANGTYQNISDIEVGTMVINKNGDPVKVINKFNKGIREIREIKTNNWHDLTYVTPDHKYWIGDLSSSNDKALASSGKAKLLEKTVKTTPKESKFKWKTIETLTKKDLLLLPNEIKWDLKSDFTIDLAEFCNRGDIYDDMIVTNNKSMFNRYLTSNYDLGYIFGTFLGDGNSHTSQYKNSERGSCHWSFNANEMHIATKLQECVKRQLDYQCSISEINGKILSVSCYNKCMNKLFSQFSKKINKHLPEKYYCTNDEYIQGIFDGLVDSDGSIEICKSKKCIYTLTNTSKQILELFYWCCMNLKISYSVCLQKKSCGTLKGTCIDNIKDAYRVKTHTFNRFTKDYVYSEVFSNQDSEPQVIWDIEVDCPTHSFIANNSIVHNSACTTRLKTGVGMPQLSAVLECADAAHGVDGHLISDGGITCPGDMAKAFGAGADFVMVGGQFAGHDQNPGEVIEEDGKYYKMFYGMSSHKAQETHYGVINTYRSSEGRVIKIPYKGDLTNTVLDYLGGLRSTCTYINAKTIKQLPKCTTFVRVSQQVNNFFGG